VVCIAAGTGILPYADDAAAFAADLQQVAATPMLVAVRRHGDDGDVVWGVKAVAAAEQTAAETRAVVGDLDVGLI
jgi:hypothetical protein